MYVYAVCVCLPVEEELFCVRSLWRVTFDNYILWHIHENIRACVTRFLSQRLIVNIL